MIKSILRNTAYYYYVIFFILSFLQTLSIDLRLIPIIKIFLFVFCITYIPQYVKTLNYKGTRYHTGNVLLILFIAYFLCSIIMYVDEDKSIQYYIQGVILYLIPLCVYFWTVSIREEEASQFYKIIKNTIFVECIVGLYLYFASPTWYVSWRLNHMVEWVGEDNAVRVYESYHNLSSTFSHPYQIAYTAVFLLSTYLYQLYHTHNNYKVLFMTFIVLLTIILAQQRVVVAFAICMMGIYIFKGLKNGLHVFYMLSIILTVGISFFITTHFDDIIFLLERYDTVVSGSILDDGRNDFAFKLLKSDYNVLLGEGANLVGHIAGSHGRPCIADGEIFKFLYEFGIIGSLIFYSFALYTILMAYKYKCYIELPVVIFFVLAMYGANPFEKDNIILIYWICAGRIWYQVRLSKLKKYIQ